METGSTNGAAVKPCSFKGDEHASEEQVAARGEKLILSTISDVCNPVRPSFPSCDMRMDYDMHDHGYAGGRQPALPVGMTSGEPVLLKGSVCHSQSSQRRIISPVQQKWTSET